MVGVYALPRGSYGRCILPYHYGIRQMVSIMKTLDESFNSVVETLLRSATVLVSFTIHSSV
jgi:hypothetical protein